MADDTLSKEDFEKIPTYLGITIASVVTVNAQNATNSAIIDSLNFLEMWERVKNKPPHFRRGNLFETIIAAKENNSNASNGTYKRTIVTHLEGRHTAPADLETYSKTGRLISEGQAKFSVMPAKKIAERIADPKYRGMDLYVPSNKINGVKREIEKQIKNSNSSYEKAELKNVLKHLKSHNTSTVEVISADKNPNKYAANYKFSIFCKNELLQTTVSSSAGNAIIAGAISCYHNHNKLQLGEINSQQATDAVIKDTSKAAVKGAAIGSTSAILRFAMNNPGSRAISSSTTTNMAYCFYDVGTTVYDFATGKISESEAILRIGKTGSCTVSGMYVGAAAGAIFGPPGVIIGGLVGYMISAQVYESCQEILENAKLAEEEAQRVISLCEAATKQMIESRLEFEKLFNEQFTERCEEFENYIDAIEDGLESEDYVATAEALTKFSELFIEELKLAKFDDFDNFMTHSNGPLVL